MFESFILTAFVIGLISAVLLPMGAATTFFWSPPDRTVAILMAAEASDTTVWQLRKSDFHEFLVQLPEAYFKGGSVVGMSTLMGFLVAIFSKTLE